jgi:hypothetical protein
MKAAPALNGTHSKAGNVDGGEGDVPATACPQLSEESRRRRSGFRLPKASIAAESSNKFRHRLSKCWVCSLMSSFGLS